MFEISFYIHNSELAVKFEENRLKQDKVPFTYRNVVKVILDTWLHNLTAYFTLKYCLFGAAKMTKNVDPHKYYFICVILYVILDLIHVHFFNSRL